MDAHSEHLQLLGTLFIVHWRDTTIVRNMCTREKYCYERVYLGKTLFIKIFPKPDEQQLLTQILFNMQMTMLPPKTSRLQRWQTTRRTLIKHIAKIIHSESNG